MTNLDVVQRVAMRFQPVNQQPCRLHGHADSLRDDRMRFAGGIADYKNAMSKTRPNSGLNDAGGEPGAVDFGLLENWPRSRARLKDMTKHRITSRHAASSFQSLESPTPNATRQARSPAIAVHHSAI